MLYLQPYPHPRLKLDEVEVKTGEEDDDVLFTSRAKLYRWHDKQWKERGLGEMKGNAHKAGHKICPHLGLKYYNYY